MTELYCLNFLLIKTLICHSSLKIYYLNFAILAKFTWQRPANLPPSVNLSNDLKRIAHIAKKCKHIF